MKFRYAMLNGVMVKQSRSRIFPWVWYTVQSEEDEVNRLKNRITLARRQMMADKHALPKAEARLKARKDALTQWMHSNGTNSGPEWAEPRLFRRFRKPVELIEDIKSPRKKDDRSAKKYEPHEIARLVVGGKRK
jgi:hypothetical protein